MKLPLGIELKRSHSQQAKELTEVMANADVNVAIEKKQAELKDIDTLVKRAQARKKKVEAELEALEAVRKAQRVGTAEEEKEE